MKRTDIFSFLTGTLRGRLIISVALVHAVMMALFIADLTARQRAILLEHQAEQAIALSYAMATSAAGWIAADDIAGMQELVDIQSRYPELLFAMLTDAQGRVLAHNDHARLGQYVQDMPGEPRQTVISRTSELVDVATPAILEGQHVGWARIGVGQRVVGKKLAGVTRSGILYALAAIVVGSIIAWFMGCHITRRLYAVQETINLVRTKDRSARSSITGNDEAALLAEEFNSMLDTLDERDAELQAVNSQLSHELLERRQAEDEVRHLKNYLANIIDSMPSLLVGLDSEGRVTQWNRQAETSTGISATEAMGKQFTELAPDFTPWIEQLRSEIQQRRSASLEKLLIEKGGERRFYDLMLYPLIANGVEGAVVRIEDVTERTRIQELMIQTEKMMSVGGLAAGMAHEINNPLGIITQAAQNIERRISPDLPANQQAAAESGIDLDCLAVYFERRQIYQFIASIREAAARASRIITNILSFSRRAEAALQPASLADIMEQALELAANDYDLKKKFDFRGIEIIRDYQPDMPQVPVVATEIEQVLLNLLKNAAQAMVANPPERKPRITLRIRQKERYAVIEVEDNGPGMTEEVRRRVFEPFFTTKEPGIGTGLGLSVSYMIITQNHKGMIEVASQPGNGACFTVRLPLRRSSNEQ